MNIDIIAGARPNFVKIAPIIKGIQKAATAGHDIRYRLIHTGQHYDKKMSNDFFEELGIPEPDLNLGANGGSQAEQTAAIMIGFEKALSAQLPELVLVVGDVTSTMACAIVAKKQNVKLAHVEAGIRSFDLSMPEEINRMVTDSITDYFFTTSEFANTNLIKAGIPENRIFFVGNVMIDTLLHNMDRLIKPAIWDEAMLKEQGYLVVTLHRPANVDREYKLEETLKEIARSAPNVPVVFPVHPRTAKILSKLSLQFANLYFIEPLSYLEFNYLVKHAQGVITDSGGITEETTVMGVPCLTMRDNTERPETCSIGTNELIGTQIDAIQPHIEKLLSGQWKTGAVPQHWDGNAAERILGTLLALKEKGSFNS